MAVKLQLQLKHTTLPEERIRSVFYGEGCFYVFYDTEKYQLGMTLRDFKKIEPLINKANQVIQEEYKQTAHLIYDFVNHKFMFAQTRQGSPSCQKKIAPILKALNEEMKDIHCVRMGKVAPSIIKPVQDDKERIADTSHKMLVEDIESYMKEFCEGKSAKHVTYTEKLDYSDLKNHDYIFVSLPDDGHITGFAFDMQRKKFYYYDPAGHDLHSKKREKAADIFKELQKNLDVEEATSSRKDHQNDDFHCGRYLLDFYKQVAEQGENFDFDQFENKTNKPIADVIDRLLETQKTLQPSGLTSTSLDCALNAVMQSIITSNHSDYFADPSNLSPDGNPAVHAAFVQLLNAYKSGHKPSTQPLRKLLNIDQTGHIDAHEVLGLFMNHYQSSHSFAKATIPESLDDLKGAIMQFPIEHDHLYVELDRFYYDQEQQCTAKLEAEVDVPEKLMINGKTYHLQSFITHLGESANNGHYITHGKMNDKWYKFDNTSVTAAQDALDHRKQAYILHYLAGQSSLAAAGA